MKKLLIIAAAIALTGCATDSGWHWEQQGSSQQQFNMDNGQCRAQGLAGTGGMLNWSTIMIMDSCMEGKGWYKVANK